MRIIFKLLPAPKHIIIWGLLLSIAGGAGGCQRLPLRPGETPEMEMVTPSRREAYFHYLRAHRFLLGGLHVGLNQRQEATGEYERILVLDPENREAILFLATLYAQQRRFGKAVRSIQELLRQEPKLVVGYFYLGRS